MLDRTRPGSECMSVASLLDPTAGASAELSTKAQVSLPRRVHRFRSLGMGLAILPLTAVLSELEAPLAAWVWVVFICLVWPQLAYAIARRSADPFRAELRNLVIDSAIAGSCLPIMHFNLLPSVVLLSVATADKVNSGVRGLWIRSLPGMLLAPFVVGILTGFAFDPHTSTQVMLACLPLLIIHTLAVSISSSRLVRKVQKQNIQLEELSRIDGMTGLLDRSYWESQAESALRHPVEGRPAVLMVIDIDRFKEINDRFGHAVGDDVLRAIADVVRENLPRGSHAGRWGGDEFVIVLTLGAKRAHEVAESIRVAVAALQFPATVDLRCTLSIGLAEAPAGTADLRSWLELADGALYRAKHSGRNQAVMA